MLDLKGHSPRCHCCTQQQRATPQREGQPSLGPMHGGRLKQIKNVYVDTHIDVPNLVEGLHPPSQIAKNGEGKGFSFTFLKENHCPS